MFYRQLWQVAVNVCETQVEDNWLSVYAYISLGKLSQSTPNKICFKHPIMQRLTVVVGRLSIYFFLQSVKNCICEVLIKRSNRLNNSVSCNLKPEINQSALIL